MATGGAPLRAPALRSSGPAASAARVVPAWLITLPYTKEVLWVGPYPIKLDGPGRCTAAQGLA